MDRLTKLQVQKLFREDSQQVNAASAYNWNFEETMTDLQLPRYQPKKKKKFCGYIGSTMLFVIKSIAIFLLMTILISLYDRFIAAPRLYKIIRANGPDVPHFDGEPEHSLDIVELVDNIEHIGLEDIRKTPK